MLSKSTFKKPKLRLQLLVLWLTSCGFLVTSAVSAASAQGITLNLNNAPLQDVIVEIRKQSSFNFMYETDYLKVANLVTLKTENAPLKAVLDQVFANQPFTYNIIEKTIVLKKKNTSTQEKISVHGRVVDSTGNVLTGATIKVKGTSVATTTDQTGSFLLSNVPTGSTLDISYLGYRRLEILAERQVGTLVLKIAASTMDAVEINVLNTGYYQLPKERATGSFTHINQEELSRSPGGNILQRLEGVANGVQFLSPNATNPLDIRVRGLSTINSNKRPLIVIDNFPYEGNYSSRFGEDQTNHVDLGFINPNDIESVTVLKDAAAASIWGARAGNGVIVITTKKGKYGQKSKIGYSHNTSIADVPDLLYDRARLPSSVVMEIEKARYASGAYTPGTSQSPAPAYVELLKKRANGSISEAEFSLLEQLMQNTEVRNEIMNHLYRSSLDQQYGLNVRGGGEHHSYYASANYDRGLSSTVGNENNRFNISTQNTFTPIKNLEFNVGLWYTQATNKTDGVSQSNLSTGNTIGLSPYLRLADEFGNPLAIVKDFSQEYKDLEMSKGLMDWNYRPLEEIGMNQNRSLGREVRISGGMKYSFSKHFDANVQYQYNWGTNTSMNDYAAASYEVRNLVNKFTQADGKQIIPYGPMRIVNTPYETKNYSGRAQLNYHQDFGSDHSVHALAGAEIREFLKSSGAGYRLYNFNKDILDGTSQMDFITRFPTKPNGSQSIPSSFPVDLYGYVDRFLSYFGNASYQYKNRYTLSSSLRWDASNLFGVKANQKGTPLWSVGGNWDIHKEDFYSIEEYVSNLRLRSTYGSAGNIYNLVSSFPTVRYNNALPNYIPQATIMSAGNPSLKWEQVDTWNTGLDFSLLNHRLSGSFDYYIRKGKDLIGEDFLAPSTGIITGGSAQSTKMINYANMTTKGFDFELQSINLTGPFSWRSTLMVNYVTNKITNVFTNPALQIYPYYEGIAAPIVGMSRDVVYANPWFGLNPETGAPILKIDGIETDNYQAYINSLSQEDLVVAGVSVAPFFGSLRNDISYKNFQLSALIMWKTGHVFRRSSLAPGAEFNGTYHMDYFDRWQKPGDENFTQIPAATSKYDNYGSTYYSFSESLITKGDHIRLQDVTLSYNINLPQWSVQRIRVMAQARNLGILWKANKFGIDPDYANSAYINPKSYSFGVQIDF